MDDQEQKYIEGFMEMSRFNEMYALVGQHQQGIRDFRSRTTNKKAEKIKIEEGEKYEVKDHDHLVQILVSGGVSVDAWGKGKAKSTHKLWEEIEAGESILTKTQANAVVRTLNVCSLYVERQGRVLVETFQSMPKQNEPEVWRHRFQIPGEKMKAGEDAREACVRGCMEEFDCTKDEVTVKEVKDVRVENIYSGSFPGLLTSYLLHEVSCDVDNPNIRDGEHRYFFTQEEKGDCMFQKHLWVWYDQQLFADCLRWREAEGLSVDTAFLK